MKYLLYLIAFIASIIQVAPCYSLDKTTQDDALSQSELSPDLPIASQQKSPGKAFLLSAIIPGTGQLYAGSKRGIFYLASEITFLASYFVLHGRADELKESYLNFVDENIVFEEDSPVNSTDTWTLEDYEHSTQSDNWHYVYTESNGEPIPRVGKFYWKDLPEDKIYEPAGELVSNSALRLEAYSKRMSANRKFKQAKLSVGLIVVNHIISAVDARIAAMSKNKKTDLSLYPLSPEYFGVCVSLKRKF